MNNIDEKPENMTRVFVKTKYNIFDFAFYKDGMFLIRDDWYQPDEIIGWLSMEQLKEKVCEKLTNINNK